MFYKPKGIDEEHSTTRTKSKGSTLWWFWLIVLALISFAVVAAIYLLIRTETEMVVTKLMDDDSELRDLVSDFARTVTRQDWKANTELFVSGSTIDFHRAFTFLTDYPPLSSNNDLLVAPSDGPLGSWGQQLSVFAGGMTSNHLMINNCNISYGSANTASMDCIGLYTYSLAYSTSFFTNNFPTQFIVFQPRFDAIKTTYQGWRFTHALALINATNTLLSSIETGVAPPGAVITKRFNSEVVVPWSPSYSPSQKRRSKRDATSTWNTLQDQINSLVGRNQIDTAKAICRTEQYILLAATFDPYQNDTSFMCNTIMRLPVTLDSPMTCGPNGSINASCLSGDLDAIQTINSITPLPATDDFTITGGVGIAIMGGMHGITIHNVGLVVLDLIAPFPFYFTKFLSFINPSITMHLNDTAPHTVWAGPSVSGPDGQPTFRLLVLDDIPLIDLATHVTNILGLSNGGTNNAGPYAGGRIIVSSPNGTRLEEAPALSDGFFLVSDGAGGFVPGTIAPGAGINISFAGGIFTVTSLDPITVVQVDLAVPTDIFQVTSVPIIDNGTLTFVVIPQAAHTFWAGPTSGSPANPSFRLISLSDIPLIDLSSHVTNILGVANGGTNNDGSSWVGERVMMSGTGGTSITEGTVTGAGGISISLGPGPNLIISGTGGTCTANDTIDQSCLDISTLSCPGGALQPGCIPSTLTLAALTVTGPSSLGTSTTCAAPLSAPCYDISGQSCPGGYLNLNCINPNLNLDTLSVNSITANDITLLNGTVTVSGVSNLEIVNTTALYTSSIVLSGPMTCSPEDTISQDCYDISGISCTAPISSNCFPINITVADLSVTNNLEVNNVACLGSPLGNDCIPVRIRTINGINPSAAPNLDFSILASTGIAITPGTNSITISNTGVTSVGLSLPSSILSVTVSPVTTTGTLTAILQTQAANSFWAGPLMGSPATPTFRLIDFLDLPTNASTNAVYFVDGAGNLGVAPLSLSLNVPSAEFALVGSPITDPSGGFVITKQNQNANSFWAGPTMGGAAQPTFRTLSLVDFAPLGLTNGQVLTGVTSGAPVGKTLVAGLNMVITEMAGSFVFDSNSVDAIQNISMTVPSWLSVTPATLYSSGTFDITANTQAAHTFLAGPTSGSPAAPSFRTIGYSDLPPLADGQLYIGSTGMAPVPTQLTAGSLITITPGPGTSTVSTSALGMVTLNLPVALYTVMSTSGTNSQTLTVSLNTQTANTVWAGPSSGGAAVPTFRPLVTADLPVAILLSYLEATYTTPAQTGLMPAVYTVITSMTLTPPAGTHWCSFSATFFPSSGSAAFDIAIHVNGVIVQHSRRVIGGAGSNFIVHTLAVVSTPGGQAVDVRFIRTSVSGTTSIYERSLYCLRIG